MNTRTYSTIEYFNRMADELKPSMAFEAIDKAGWRRWRRAFKAKLVELIGPFPEACPLDAEVLEQIEEPDHFREKVVYNTEKYASVPAYVLIPRDLGVGEKRRGLLCLHGHGPYGKESVVGIRNGDLKRIRVIEAYNYDYALQFVRRGYVTITPDFRGFGERGDGGRPYGDRDPCNVNFIKGSLMGVNLMALNLWDLFRALDYFEERPEVDPGRIGCMGLSFGGTMALYLAALDRRIKAALISGYLTTFRAYAIRMGGLCGSQYIPGLARYGDVVDVAALIAPRPLLIESGIQDEGFPIAAAEEAFAKLRRVYEVLGVPERVDHDRFDGGHRFSGRKAFNWFDRWL